MDRAGRSDILTRCGDSVRPDDYAAADLMASGSPTPGVVISGRLGVKVLAFDKAGNLWANDDADHIVEYLASHLGATSSAAPDAVVGAQTPMPVVTSSNP